MQVSAIMIYTLQTFENHSMLYLIQGQHNLTTEEIFYNNNHENMSEEIRASCKITYKRRELRNIKIYVVIFVLILTLLAISVVVFYYNWQISALSLLVYSIINILIIVTNLIIPIRLMKIMSKMHKIEHARNKNYVWTFTLYMIIILLI